MQKRIFIERILRQIYNGMPTDDSSITVNLVAAWLPDAIASAAKQNYKDNLQLEGIAYNNNSFFTKFKGLTITPDEQFLYKTTMPSIPLGIGSVDGISRVELRGADGQVSMPVVIMTQAQVSFFKSMRNIQSKLVGYPEGNSFYFSTPLILDEYTASITMISNGEGDSLDAEINVPSDYFPQIVEYIKAQLAFERAQVVNTTNDGTDVVRSA